MRVVFYSLLILVLAGCSGDRQAVESVASQRDKALATGDISLYISLLSPNYRDKGKDFQTKRAELEGMFHSFGPVSYRSLGRKVTIRGDEANVTGRYVLKAAMRGKPLELAGEEDLRLRRESGKWKIIGGL